MGQLEGTPKDYGLEYENVFFSAADGIRLHGWFVPSSNPGKNHHSVVSWQCRQYKPQIGKYRSPSPPAEYLNLHL